MKKISAFTFAISLCTGLLLTVFLISCQPGTSDSSDKTEKSDSATGGPGLYKIAFRTSCDSLAGTDANLFIQLFGKNGKSPETQLNTAGANEFLACSRDEFELSVENNLGELDSLRVWHDNSGPDPSWKVEIITIIDVKTGKRSDWPCGKWFATDKDNKVISRMFYTFRECK